jgi:hypothetical protein
MNDLELQRFKAGDGRTHRGANAFGVGNQMVPRFPKLTGLGDGQLGTFDQIIHGAVASFRTTLANRCQNSRSKVAGSAHLPPID